MKPSTRVDIIVGKLKPMGNKPSMRMERGPDKMQSSDFVQKVDMSEEDMMYESCGEAIMQAIKQHDAKALAQAICDLIEMHEHSSEENKSGASHWDESEGPSGEADEEEAY